MTASRLPRSSARAIWTPVLLAAAGVFLGSVSAPVQAQATAKPMYRIVGPDGQVTFTDRPPPSADTARVLTPLPAAAAPTANLPAELATAVNRFPVTLFMGATCTAACVDARALLRERGIPHVVRTVTTPRDTAELQRLTGAALLPSLTVGRQPLPGFRRSEWVGYLDAAGYPATSRLPSGYRAPEPAPLSPEPAPAASAPEAPTLPQPIPSGPGGIRF